MGGCRPPLDDIQFLVEPMFELQTSPSGAVDAELAGAMRHAQRRRIGRRCGFQLPPNSRSSCAHQARMRCSERSNSLTSSSASPRK